MRTIPKLLLALALTMIGLTMGSYACRLAILGTADRVMQHAVHTP